MRKLPFIIGAIAVLAAGHAMTREPTPLPAPPVAATPSPYTMERPAWAQDMLRPGEVAAYDRAFASLTGGRALADSERAELCTKAMAAASATLCASAMLDASSRGAVVSVKTGKAVWHVTFDGNGAMWRVRDVTKVW